MIANFSLLIPGIAFAAKVSAVYDFKGGADGSGPDMLVASAGGIFYGTTGGGGIVPCSNNSEGCGTVFTLMRSGKTYVKRTIYAFGGGNDGFSPTGNIVIGPGGVIYGTTQEGGTSDDGIIYELSPSGNSYTETILYDLANNGGEFPDGLTADQSGNLFGIAALGGPLGDGFVFKLAPTQNGYVESDIYDFGSSPADALYPGGALTIGPDGAMYGSFSAGGPTAYGGLFRLSLIGSSYSETIIGAFDFKNGQGPASALNFDNAENIYGTTSSGGHCFSKGCGMSSGVAFRFSPTQNGYNGKAIHVFKSKDDGMYPSTPLVPGPSGTFYGATAGGSGKPLYGDGLLFKLTPSGQGYAETIPAALPLNDGFSPGGGLILGADRALYGTAGGGGTYGEGTIYKIEL